MIDINTGNACPKCHGFEYTIHQQCTGSDACERCGADVEAVKPFEAFGGGKVIQRTGRRDKFGEYVEYITASGRWAKNPFKARIFMYYKDYLSAWNNLPTDFSRYTYYLSEIVEGGSLSHTDTVPM